MVTRGGVTWWIYVVVSRGDDDDDIYKKYIRETGWQIIK
jgi:hypothetical protein